MNVPAVFIMNRKTPPYIVQPTYDDNGILKSQAIALKFDCHFNETHSIKNEVTRFPIESGLDIADHIKQEPDDLSVTGFITNSPIGYFAVPSNGVNRVQSAFDTLMRLAGRKNTKVITDTDGLLKPVVIDIFTTLRFWMNMVIVSLQVKRDPDTGDAIEFTMELTSIRKIAVNAANVNYSDTSRSGGAGGIDDQLTDKTDAGKKDTPKPKPRTESYLKTASEHGLGGAIKSFKDGLLDGIEP